MTAFHIIYLLRFNRQFLAPHVNRLRYVSRFSRPDWFGCPIRVTKDGYLQE